MNGKYVGIEYMYVIQVYSKQKSHVPLDWNVCFLKNYINVRGKMCIAVDKNARKPV